MICILGLDVIASEWEESEDYAALFRRVGYESRTPQPLAPIADDITGTYNRLQPMNEGELLALAERFGLAVAYPVPATIAGEELERLDAMIEEASK